LKLEKRSKRTGGGLGGEKKKQGPRGRVGGGETGERRVGVGATFTQGLTGAWAKGERADGDLRLGLAGVKRGEKL